MILARVLRSALVDLGPIFALARKAFPSALNHKVAR